MTTLAELGARYGTDKGREHHYLTHYARHLEHLRDRDFTLLEIGIGGYALDGVGGGSLRMWRDYFPRARIVGLDIEDKSFVDDGRITTYRGSQTDPTVLARIVREQGRPLVVIDDGSHRPADLRATFRLLFPQLLDGGVYALEDLQTSYWPESGGRRWRHAPGTSMALVKDLVDGVNHEEIIGRRPSYTDENVTGVHCYHNLAVIEKGDNREGTNKVAANPGRFGDEPDSTRTRLRALRVRTQGEARAALRRLIG